MIHPLQSRQIEVRRTPSRTSQAAKNQRISGRQARSKLLYNFSLKIFRQFFPFQPTMAHIEPFRALRYDPARVSIPRVVTQPYDKITPEMQEGYYAASAHNLVRVILGKQHAGDHAGEDRYSRAAQFFGDWRSQGIFLQDPEPSLYLYVQRFTVPGRNEAELERRGIIALGRIEDYSSGVIFRHEQTLAKPKADRLDLLRATRAHFGQLFMLYSDPAGEIDGLLKPGNTPDLETQDEYGVSHRLWKISDPGLIGLVCGKMQDKKLIIADGHHRYETALNYRNEQRKANGKARQMRIGAHAAPYELVMMTLVNMDSPGLVDSADPSRCPRFGIVFGGSLPRRSEHLLQRRGSGRFARRCPRGGHPARSGTDRDGDAGGDRRPGLSSRSSPAGATYCFRRLVVAPAIAGCGAIAPLPAGRRAADFRGIDSRPEKCALHSRHRRGHGTSAKRGGECGFSDESGAHVAGARHCVCRRSLAAEVHGFLSQAADGFDNLFAGVGWHVLANGEFDMRLHLVT